MCVSLFGAVLKSRPRLIDLHYLIVQRLPPAARAYASAFCFILGLNMEFSGCADDKYQVTAAFRRWLECDSRIPRTWGALLVALRREISPTWVDDITEDLVRKYAHADVCTCHDNVQNLRGVCMSGPCLVDMHLQLPPCTLYHARSVCLCVSMLDLGSACACVWGQCNVLIHTFSCLPVPCTVHADGGIAALPGPERFCGNCRRDFSKEHEDDSGGIMEAKEESGIPPSEEMVVRCSCHGAWKMPEL